MKWPLGINPEMDKHAIKFGLPNWSCVSPKSNTLWIRKDGFHFVFENTMKTYTELLRKVDIEHPQQVDFVPLTGSNSECFVVLEKIEPRGYWATIYERIKLVSLSKKKAKDFIKEQKNPSRFRIQIRLLLGD